MRSTTPSACSRASSRGSTGRRPRATGRRVSDDESRTTPPTSTLAPVTVITGEYGARVLAPLLARIGRGDVRVRAGAQRLLRRQHRRDRPAGGVRCRTHARRGAGRRAVPPARRLPVQWRFVRRSLEKSYRQHFSCYVLPFIGDLELNSLTVDTLEDFRMYLSQDREISLNSAKNVISGSLQAMLRDARRKIERNPFNDVPRKWWPRQQQDKPDPYTEKERDAILKYYRANRPYWAYVFVYFRFYTGTRPSEATALKWRNIDLVNAKAAITSSRTFKEENAPKTLGSARTVKLLPNVIELLKTILPLHVEPSSYVFTDEQGKPIDQNEFGRKFGDVLRVLELQQRPFYNTRHTYISIALTLGTNSKWVAEQTGTSLAMIEKSYGKYIRDDGDAPLQAYVAKQRASIKPKRAKTETVPVFSRRNGTIRDDLGLSQRA